VKHIAILCLVTFSVTLAVICGQRMSHEVMQEPYLLTDGATCDTIGVSAQENT
jgi:hypothetical protein